MISCHLHDYVEVVCLYQYPIKLTLKSGLLITGIARDTVYNDMRQECLKLDVAGKECLVVLDDLSHLEVRVPNPHFQAVAFS